MLFDVGELSCKLLMGANAEYFTGAYYVPGNVISTLQFFSYRIFVVTLCRMFYYHLQFIDLQVE